MSDTNKQNSCSERPCQSRTIERPHSTGSDDVNFELRGRPVLYAGVVWIGILRRFLIPRTCVSPLPPLADLDPMPRSQEPPEAVSVNHVPAHDSATHSLAQNLPHPAALLGNKRSEEELERRRLEMLKHNSSNSWHSPLAALVSQMHEASLAAAEQALRLTEDISALLRNSRDTTATIVSQMHEAALAATEQALQLTEDIGALMRDFRETPRAAAGLAGHLVGRPRGRATRVVYTVTGATAAAMVCYPAEASVYNHQALVVLRRWLGYCLAALKQRQDPQRPLGDGDSKISKSSKPAEQPQNRQLNFHSPAQNSNITPSEDSHQENNEQYAYSESCSFSEGGSDEGVNTPQDPAEYLYSSAPPMPPGPVGPTSRSVRKLLSQCQPEDVTVRPTLPNSVTYTPDFPSPQKARQSFNSSDQFGMPQNPTSKDLPTSSSKENVRQHAVSQHPNNRRGHPNPKLQDLDTNNLEVTQKIHPNKASESNPNTLGIDKHSLACGYDDQSQYPLNKKLSRYYVKKTDGTTATLETGYDDLYSKRE